MHPTSLLGKLVFVLVPAVLFWGAGIAHASKGAKDPVVIMAVGIAELAAMFILGVVLLYKANDLEPGN